MISCLMVTRPGRLRFIERGVQCFESQTHAEKELLIVHDGDEPFDRSLREVRDRFPMSDIRVHRASRTATLGELRNLSVSLAKHPFICQWDDDDLFHPCRLSEQFGQLRKAGADCCFFTDQLHWFEAVNQWYWDDWTVERPPGHLIQGSILSRREIMPSYPHERRGEDSGLVRQLVRDGARITELTSKGYLYIYSYNGANAWDFSHHAAISRWKHKPRSFLETHRPILIRHIRDYALALQEAVFPLEDGVVVLDLS